MQGNTLNTDIVVCFKSFYSKYTCGWNQDNKSAFNENINAPPRRLRWKVGKWDSESNFGAVNFLLKFNCQKSWNLSKVFWCQLLITIVNNIICHSAFYKNECLFAELQQHIPMVCIMRFPHLSIPYPCSLHTTHSWHTIFRLIVLWPVIWVTHLTTTSTACHLSRQLILRFSNWRLNDNIIIEHLSCFYA